MYWILDGVRFRILFSTNLQWDPIATLWKECGPSQFYKATSYQSSWRVTQGSLVCLTMCFCELGGCTFLKRPVASSWFYKQAQVCSPSSWGNWDPELLSPLPQGSRKMAQLVRCLPHKHDDCAQSLFTYMRKPGSEVHTYSPRASRQSQEASSVRLCWQLL